MDKIQRKNLAKKRRQYRARRKIFGTSDRPRLSIFRSNKHIYAQLIDDVSGVTLASSSTRGKGLSDDISYGGNSEAAKKVGQSLAKQATGVGIKLVKFDRNRFKYHGRIKALAGAAREGGLVF